MRLIDHPLLSRREMLAQLAWGAVAAGTVAAADQSVPTQDVAPLSVEHGQFYRAGRPLRALGINYFDCFSQMLTTDPAQYAAARQRYEAGFDELQQFGIPFIRFNAGGFYPINWQLYDRQGDVYWQRLRDLVQAAAERGLGLIPSLFWTFFTQPGRAAEPISAWGDADSRTHGLMQRYVDEMFDAVGQSPAVWGWELGNEYNLEIDLPNRRETLRHWFQPSLGMPSAPSDRDTLSSGDLRVATAAFGAAVRQRDSKRPIFSGHACPRTAAWNLEHHGNWTADSVSQWSETLAAQNPAPLDTLSIHFYPFHDGDGTGPRAQGDLPHGQQTLRVAMDVARQTGQPLWVGEFGHSPKANPSTRLQQMQQIIDWLEAGQVTLAAAWVYDYQPQVENNLATIENRPLLELIAATNARWSADCGDCASR